MLEKSDKQGILPKKCRVWAGLNSKAQTYPERQNLGKTQRKVA